jgi:hypothetical protein
MCWLSAGRWRAERGWNVSCVIGLGAGTRKYLHNAFRRRVISLRTPPFPKQTFSTFFFIGYGRFFSHIFHRATLYVHDSSHHATRPFHRAAPALFVFSEVVSEPTPLSSFALPLFVRVVLYLKGNRSAKNVYLHRWHRKEWKQKAILSSVLYLVMYIV